MIEELFGLFIGAISVVLPPTDFLQGSRYHTQVPFELADEVGNLAGVAQDFHGLGVRVVPQSERPFDSARKFSHFFFGFLKTVSVKIEILKSCYKRSL